MALASGSTEQDVPTRPVVESLREISVFSFVACMFTGAMIGLVDSGNGAQQFAAYVARCAEIGAVVINHVGWEFGVIVPVLLGFYVLILGGRWVMGHESHSRRPAESELGRRDACRFYCARIRSHSCGCIFRCPASRRSGG